MARVSDGKMCGVSEPVAVEIVAAILRRGDRLLLCHRHPNREWYPDVWDLPGGHIEQEETPADALARELREELAVELVSPLGPPFETIDAVPGLRLTIWLVDYHGVVTNEAPDEHDELRWVTLDELRGLALAHPSYGEMLERAAAR